MNFVLSNHAKEELARRDIPLEVLEVVLAAPEQILEEDDLSVFQARYAATNGKTYLLRAYVNSSVEPARVVTVYRTSKIEKYWRPG